MAQWLVLMPCNTEVLGLNPSKDVCMELACFPPSHQRPAEKKIGTCVCVCDVGL